MEHLEELIKQLEKLNANFERQSEPKILKVTDISRILGVNRNQATKLFKRPDFPALVNCGDNKIEQTAFYNWLQSRHSNDCEDDELGEH